jgi:hypothetical protein
MNVCETTFDLPPPAQAQAPVPDHGLCLPHVQADEAVALWDELVRDLRPRSAVARILVEQMYRSELSARQCRRLRASLQAEKIRTADRMWQNAQQDDVEHFRRMLPTEAATAVIGLRRFAAGARWMAAEWTKLQSFLDQDGTLYGNQRRMAIHLLGFSAEPEDVYLHDEAYLVWRYCFEAQPTRSERDGWLLDHVDVIPKRFRENPSPSWPPTAEFSRAQLQALIDRELPPLLALADELHVTDEQPSDAAARDKVLARVSQAETQLLREIQGHERGFQHAAAKLERLRRQPPPVPACPWVGPDDVLQPRRRAARPAPPASPAVPESDATTNATETSAPTDRKTTSRGLFQNPPSWRSGCSGPSPRMPCSRPAGP